MLVNNFFTPIKTRGGKLVFLLLVFSSFLYYMITERDFYGQIWQKINTPFHTVTDNTLPLEFIWSFTTSDALKVPPLVNSQTVVFLRENNTLTALDIRSGSIKWEYTLGTNIRVPDTRFIFDLNETILVIVDRNSQLLALNAENGEIVWQSELSSPLRTTANVQLLGDLVIVSSFSIYPSTEGYVASYRLENGEFIAHLIVPSRTFQYQFLCTGSPEKNDSGERMIYVTLHDRLWTIDVANELTVVNNDFVSLYSLDVPYCKDGFIFTNPSPVPSPQVYDIKQKRGLALPASCSRNITSHPVTSYENLVLVANGCNELYVIETDHLTQDPDWLFGSVDEILTSFVTIDGKIGFTLTAQGVILGVDLASGRETGKILTTPGRLNRGQFRNSLFVNAHCLFALLDGNTLLAFKQKPHP